MPLDDAKVMQDIGRLEGEINALHREQASIKDDIKSMRDDLTEGFSKIERDVSTLSKYLHGHAEKEQGTVNGIKVILGVLSPIFGVVGWAIGIYFGK